VIPLTIEERKVNARGQITIPKAMRKALKLDPGSRVLIERDDDKLTIRKVPFDAVAVFQRVAQEGSSIKEIDAHAYEEELEERFRRASVKTK
jgi:AbrB family looped-hinge helix DNA binding protein